MRILIYAMLLAVPGTAMADTISVDPVTPYAWCENAGWLNAHADGNGLTLPTGAGTASGMAWLENAGWVNFGDGLPATPPYYGNTMGEDSGVNHDGAGNLFGLAWGENIGWVNFGTALTPLVSIGEDGQLMGQAWSENLGWIEFNSGQGVMVLLPSEGEAEGFAEGTGEGSLEGVAEGALEGNPEGFTEGLSEGILEGEGGFEGEAPTIHSADTNNSGKLSLSELLRVVQLYNAEALSCVTGGGETEDGYQPFTGDQQCGRHNSDYRTPAWVISLSELLRAVQLFNSGGYTSCPEMEDRFCPGA